MAKTVFRLIGETDIVDIDPATVDGGAHPKLMGLDDADRINLLGHWLDQDRGEELQDDADFKSAMTVIGACPRRLAGRDKFYRDHHSAGKMAGGIKGGFPENR